MNFGEAWLYNSVCIKLHKPGTVPGFGVKQGPALQQRLLIKSLKFSVENCSALVYLWCNVQVLFGTRSSQEVETQQCCLMERPLI